MKTKYFFFIAYFFFLISCKTETKKVNEEFQHIIEINNGERWWAGVIADSHLFPMTSNASYSFNFYGNTAGNQGQPLLISSHGRYIWNDEPFQFEISESKISVRSNFKEFEIGQSGSTLKEAYKYASSTFFPPSGKLPAEELFTLAQFNTWIEFTYYQNQEGILEYARSIVEKGYKPGVLMIDEGWFETYGHWDFDRSSFHDPKAMMAELKALGFKVILWVCPYYTPNGPFWKEQWLKYSQKGDTIWIVNADNPAFPALMQWWDGFSNVIDLSNPKGNLWFKEQLDYLVNEYGIDGFKFDGGDANHFSDSRFLSRHSSYKKEITPNEHSELFVKLGLEYPFNEYRAAWKMGGQPIAMRLRDKSHTWEDLRKLVPGIINQGLMGYPFSCPDLIGGGEYLSFLNLEAIDQELIVRAAQCHALMPMMQFSVAPWRVLNEQYHQICKDMADLHADTGNEIMELAKLAAETGEPIIRHLAYEFPGKGYEDINDQFILGSDILVAPVLQKEARKRTVIFPEGHWLGDDGSKVDGPAEIEIEVPIQRLPWYRKSAG